MIYRMGTRLILYSLSIHVILTMVTETQERIENERLTAIEATLPHLATQASMERGFREMDNKISAVERRMLWTALGLAVGIGVNIIVSLATIIVTLLT